MTLTRHLYVLLLSGSLVALGWLASACGAPAEPQAPAPALPNAPLAPTPTSSASPPQTGVVPAPSPAAPAAPSASAARSAADALPDASSTDPDPSEAAALAHMSDTERPVMLAVKACIERSLRANEEPKGSLAIDLVVAPDGSVTSVKLADGYPPRMRACLEARIRAVAFPKGETTRFLRIPINESQQ